MEIDTVTFIYSFIHIWHW